MPETVEIGGVTAEVARSFMERLKGLMMASWQLTLPAFEAEIMSGFDQTAPAMELLGWNV